MVLPVPGRASSPHPSPQKVLSASPPVSLPSAACAGPAHGPTVSATPAHTADPGTQSCLWPAASSGLPLASLLLLLPPLHLAGVPAAPGASRHPAGEARAPGSRRLSLSRAHLCPAALEDRESGQAGLLRRCRASGFYTCSHQACLQLGLQLSLRLSRGLRPGTGGPQGLPGTWHVHTGLGRLTIGSAWPP